MTDKKQSIPSFKPTGFMILDVGSGRKALAKYIEKGGKPIKITIDAVLDEVYSGDDGVSIEFHCEVKNVKYKKEKINATRK